ncbi:uncharacterized protein METZ01_LOCUS326638 [marine metagenome]|uniref:Uncharacterized protein n=1 Tax=marine metagenome TaxID=408172 RepID=A0A382PK77_9ZZZZ
MFLLNHHLKYKSTYLNRKNQNYHIMTMANV